MKLLTAFLLLSSSALAAPVADFSGHWIVHGGTVRSNVGLKGECSQIELKIEQTATLLRTQLYKADCGNYSTHWGPVDQFIRDGKVYEGEGEEEEEVGTISGDTLLTLARSGSVVYAYNLKLHPTADGSKTLQTYYGVKNAIGAIAIEGMAEKQKSPRP